MMATIQFKKGDEYLAKVAKLEAMTRDEICGSAIYGAAGIIADEIREQLKGVPTDERYGTQSKPTDGPKKMQKMGLLHSLGIADLRDDGTGYLNVKIGWNGYNNIKTRQWPSGQPNQMVARSVERGTSYMKENGFVKRSVAATRKRALEFMKRTIDSKCEQIMK